MIHHVKYVEDSVNKWKSFRSDRGRKAWVYEFLLENQNNEDYWVDFILNGSMEYASISEEGNCVGHRDYGLESKKG